jgi:hypothetical protein
MRYLDVCLIALTAVSALGWYVLWVLDGPPRTGRRLAVLAVVAFVATVVAHQIKVASFPPADAGFTGRP